MDGCAPPPQFPFPIDLSKYRKVSIDPYAGEPLTVEQIADLQFNVQLCRDSIVFFTACAGASGLGGHTGGPYDTCPEVCLLDAYFRARPDKFVPIFFDEAGHRAATQYLLNVLRGKMAPEKLMSYRVPHSGLTGHPELGHLEGVEFSSGRLGHMFPMVNGVARAYPSKVVCCLGSDGSQMEGNNAEAARLAAAQALNVKLFIDDNDVTITGHPSEYLGPYNVGNTLRGHGVPSSDVDGENIEALHLAMVKAVTTDGPYALVIKRKMCPAMAGVEGTTHGHDVVSKASAIEYLTVRGHTAAVHIPNTLKEAKDAYKFIGGGAMGAPRQAFGAVVAEVLQTMVTKTDHDSG
jgi:transketolase N-terminal domain/subunit